MVTPRRPSRPKGSKSAAKLIEDLPCLVEVDRMLMEGVTAPDVAKYIQEEKSELLDVSQDALAKALSARRRKRQQSTGWWGADPDEEENEGDELREEMRKYRRLPQTPSRVVQNKGLYDRTEGGIRDMIELEGAFLAQRDRVDRMMELEALSGAFSDLTTKAIDSMTEILWKRIQARAKMNESASGDDLSFNLSIRRYSQQTMEVMSNPESRHRIMSLLERLARFGKSRVPLPPVSLPLPQSTPEK
jgi:hypothetical protein